MKKTYQQLEWENELLRQQVGKMQAVSMPALIQAITALPPDSYTPDNDTLHALKFFRFSGDAWIWNKGPVLILLPCKLLLMRKRPTCIAEKFVPLDAHDPASLRSALAGHGWRQV